MDRALDAMTGLLYFTVERRMLVVIPTDIATFHGLMFDLISGQKYEPLFGDLRWQDRIFGKYSPKLDLTLWALEMGSEIVEFSDHYEVCEKLKKRWSKTCLQLFKTTDEIELLQELADALSTRLGVMRSQA